MNTRNEKMKVSMLTYAVQGALALMFAMPLAARADDAADAAENAKNAVEAMRHPVNTVEVGVKNVSEKSNKFGEYNGLNDKGASLIGNFNLRGGDAYNSNAGTYRYDFKGRDIGTTSREITGTGSKQGSWNFGFGYDELTHYTATGFQTPYVEAQGSNRFTLPAGYGFIYTATPAVAIGAPCTIASTAGCVGGAVVNAGTRTLTAAQLAAMNPVDVAMTRKNASFIAGYSIDEQLSVQFDYSHLKQDGAKLIGSGTSSSTTNTAGGYTTQTSTAGLFTREANTILLNPSNYTTDTFNLGANWKSENAHLHAVYSASFFKDAYDGLYWESPYLGNIYNTTALPSAYLTNALSTAPSNQLHQMALNGGVDLTSTTKLAGSYSRGINRQNDAFNNDTAFMITAMPVNGSGVTQASLQGQVKNTHADLKLTDRTVQNLTLNAGFKYNERNNQTPSMRMSFQDLRGTGAAVTWQVVNTPYSNKSTLIDLGAEYRLDQSQSLRLGYENESVKRWCNGILPTTAAASGAGAVANGFNTSMPIGTVPGCVLTPSSTENRIGVTYKLKPSPDLSVIADLSHAKRTSTTDWNYVNPLGTTGVVTGAAPGPGQLAQFVGNGTFNAGNYYGWKSYFDSSRNQDVIKLRTNWSATDELSFVAAVRLESNKYTDSPLGVQNGRGLSVNLDATYAYTEDGSLSAYVSQTDRRRDNLSLGATNAASVSQTYSTPGDPAAANNIFKNMLKESSTLIGLNLKQQVNEAWDMAGDLSYTKDTSGYTTLFNYALSATPAATTGTCSFTNVLSCGDTPKIETKIITLNLVGGYKIDKASKVKFGYTFQKLDSTDYYYNGLQYGYTPTAMMPSNQQAPSYRVHAIGASYIYSFN